MGSYPDTPSPAPVTAPPGELMPSGGRHNTRAVVLVDDLAALHAGLAAWAETRSGEPLPALVVDMPLQGATLDEELAHLHRVAAAWGVEVRSHEDGTRTAERRFGSVIVRATHPGRQRAEVDFRPLLTLQELRMEQRDKDEGRHWAWNGDCWCGVPHQASLVGLALITPPWDKSRDGDTAW
jgi:hypothetical protein